MLPLCLVCIQTYPTCLVHVKSQKKTTLISHPISLIWTPNFSHFAPDFSHFTPDFSHFTPDFSYLDTRFLLFGHPISLISGLQHAVFIDQLTFLKEEKRREKKKKQQAGGGLNIFSYCQRNAPPKKKGRTACCFLFFDT